MNPYKSGDKVIILKTIKDAYGETWHDIGDKQIVDHIANDRLGLFFRSGLGTHYENVKPDIEIIRDNKIEYILS